MKYFIVSAICICFASVIPTASLQELDATGARLQETTERIPPDIAASDTVTGSSNLFPDTSTKKENPSDASISNTNINETTNQTQDVIESQKELLSLPEPLDTTSFSDDSKNVSLAVEEIPKLETSTLKISTEAHVDNSSFPVTMLNASSRVVDKLSDQIRIILKHFQNPAEVALPGDVIIPDPMEVPDRSGSIGVIDGNFTNITVQEQSKFTIDTVNTNLDEMQIYVSLKMKRLIILGNYSMSTFLFGTSEGPFNVTLTDVLAEATVYLARDTAGRIFANKSVTNMMQQGIVAHFVNSSSVYQGFINTVATFLFIGVKPYVLSKVDEKLCTDINKRLEHIAFRLPQFPLSPVDLAVLEGRKYVRKMGYDPFVIKDVFKYDQDFLVLSVNKFTVHGLSKFYRVGNVTLLMENNNIQFGVRLMTSRLEGNLEWFYDFGKIGMTRNGTSKFTINRIQVEAIVNQPVDIRNKPVLDSLDIETGPITVKMDGEGSFDYVVEFVVLLLPKMIRLMIIDSLEIPIKYKVQEILNNVDVEKLVDSNLDDIEYYITHFKLDL